MVATLTVVAGPDRGLTCPVSTGEVLVVGRGADCGLRLSDPGVSRIHCRLMADHAGVRLEDAKSRFGTLVNRKLVIAQLLQPGDTIGLGDTELEFRGDPSLEETVLPFAPIPEWLQQESVTYDAQSSDPAMIDDLNHLVGTTFVRFRLESVIARSASGLLFYAIDSVNNRPLALKIFWPSLFADHVAMSRFLRSMRATVPLRHPNLVRLFAAGCAEDRCFIASEFVDGKSVAQIVDQIGIVGMLDWRTTWRIAVGVVRALVFLHENGVIHRGIHPANIFVRDADHTVKLGDSLLAKSLEELGQPALTVCGELVGDLHYCAPEQLTGNPVDVRSDLYSVGATLYALLTGTPPFTGSAAQLVRQIPFVAPEPPKARHLAVSTAFEGIVLRLLAKHPADRYQHAADLLEELLRIGGYEGLTA